MITLKTMGLKFDGIEYRTIADVKERYKVSEKSLKRWIKQGLLPPPKVEARGGRPFRHYTDRWCEALATFLKQKRGGG
jgi:DNA-binding transcriptional MerR regulator